MKKRFIGGLTALFVVCLATMSVSAAGFGARTGRICQADCSPLSTAQNCRYQDVDGDGLCDVCGTGFVDADGDGVCDRQGTGTGQGFVDEDGDGVCDRLGTGMGRGAGWRGGRK